MSEYKENHKTGDRSFHAISGLPSRPYSHAEKNSGTMTKKAKKFIKKKVGEKKRANKNFSRPQKINRHMQHKCQAVNSTSM